jgi:hypothetical protein
MKTINRFFLPLLLAALSPCSTPAADSVISLTNTGSAVASWDANDGYNLKDTKWPGEQGGILLGNVLVQSHPTYTFFLPPPQITPGIQELTAIKVLVTGTGSGADIVIGNTPAQLLGPSPYSFTSNTLFRLFSPIAPPDHGLFFRASRPGP